MSRILVTGGTGYIGTHVLAALSEAGHHAIPLDNFSNSSPAAAERLREITPRIAPPVEIDLRDRLGLAGLLARERVDAVIHLAGLKAVGESVEQPLRYYDNNVRGTVTLLQALADANVTRFVFGSSATVYSPEGTTPSTEQSAVGPTSPYGRTKRLVEQILEDTAAADPRWRIAVLRYFNPAGAHSSGVIGEHPRGVPNNLMPYVCRVAAGQLSRLQIFGNDYPTPDGTGGRDYIHVCDLAEGHVAALGVLEGIPAGEVLTANLGTGRGVSVKELIETFERVNGIAIARETVSRRPGDVAVYCANPEFAQSRLGWKARRSLEDICRDAWRYAERSAREKWP